MQPELDLVDTRRAIQAGLDEDTGGQFWERGDIT